MRQSLSQMCAWAAVFGMSTATVSLMVATWPLPPTMLRADTLARWYAITVFRPKNLEILKKNALAICNYHYSFKNIDNGHSTRYLYRQRGSVIAPTHLQPSARKRWVVKTGHFTPGKDPTPTVEEAGWALKQMWSAQKISQPLGSDPQTIQPVGSWYTDVTPAI